jgi:hypothetical protein
LVAPSIGRLAMPSSSSPTTPSTLAFFPPETRGKSGDSQRCFHFRMGCLCRGRNGKGNKAPQTLFFHDNLLSFSKGDRVIYPSRAINSAGQQATGSQSARRGTPPRVRHQPLSTSLPEVASQPRIVGTFPPRCLSASPSLLLPIFFPSSSSLNRVCLVASAYRRISPRNRRVLFRPPLGIPSCVCRDPFGRSLPSLTEAPGGHWHPTNRPLSRPTTDPLKVLPSSLSSPGVQRPVSSVQDRPSSRRGQPDVVVVIL